MAVDATGVPTSPDSIPKYATSADAPSGKGFNAAMDAIQVALSARASKPAGIVSGEVPVWNGTTWVRSSVTNIAPTSLGSGTPDATKFLRGDGSWGLPVVPSVRAFHNVAQSINTATLTILSLNSERFDTDTIHDLVTNNSRLTCRTAGTYEITAQVEFANNVTGLRQTSIIMNGVTRIARVDGLPVAGGVTQQLTVSTLYALAVNDYVEVEVYQDSGVALNVMSGANYSPEFSMVRVA